MTGFQVSAPRAHRLDGISRRGFGVIATSPRLQLAAQSAAERCRPARRLFRISQAFPMLIGAAAGIPARRSAALCLASSDPIVGP